MSTKIHAAVDGLGNPVRFILTEGQSSKYYQAEELIEGFQADFVLADKGCESNEFIEKIRASSAVAEILARKNRIESREAMSTIFLIFSLGFFAAMPLLVALL